LCVKGFYHSRIASLLVSNKEAVETFGAEVNSPIRAPLECSVIIEGSSAFAEDIVIPCAAVTFFSPPYTQVVEILTPENSSFKQLPVAAAVGFFEDKWAVVQTVHSVDAAVGFVITVACGVSQVIAHSHISDNGISMKLQSFLKHRLHF
jgi:hypothetical protein